MSPEVGSSRKIPASTLYTDFDNHAGLRGVYYRLRSRYSVYFPDYQVARGDTGAAVQKGAL